MLRVRLRTRIRIRVDGSEIRTWIQEDKISPQKKEKIQETIFLKARCSL